MDEELICNRARWLYANFDNISMKECIQTALQELVSPETLSFYYTLFDITYDDIVISFLKKLWRYNGKKIN